MSIKRNSSSSITTQLSILLPLLISCFSPFQLSHATTDTLLPNQTIRDVDGQSLISSNGTYELGFFSPGGGSSNRYVGIWYHKIPGQTVVWVANRDRPILDSSGFLTIDGGGDLMIFDAIGTSIVVASNARKTNLTQAILLDSGNLLLRGFGGIGDGPVSWQSFDDPTHTFLPGMKIGLYGRQNRLITSWKSADDPGQGDFSMGIDPNGTSQFFIWQRGQVYWRSGAWNGQNFSLVPEMTADYFRNFSYIPDWSGGHYSYSFQDRSTVSRGVMDFSGQVRQLTWMEDQWVLYFAEPKLFLCEVPYYCGPNGLCSNNSSPTCKCLIGFQPNYVTQGESSNWAGGCVRRAHLQCGSADAFLKLTGVKLPIFFSRRGDSSVGLDDCSARCLQNCSCTAYASANANGTGCLLWFQDLLGLQENIGDSVQDLYVRLVASELNPASDHGRKRMLVVVISVVVSVMVLLLGVFLCYYLIWRKTKGEEERSQELLMLEIRTKPDTTKHGEGEMHTDCSFFSFTTIATATNNFSASNKLGEGGFGPVYKGSLEGCLIAVKRLSRGSWQGLEEFKNEINLIANLQHTNLVRLLGYCVQKEEKILIYEYMPNKSLDFYIFDEIKGAQLNWPKRFHIIEGIAQGILYLHKYSRLKVIHRDLKTSNILLDGEMNPRISDFGMARIFGQNENEANTRRVVGTYGYMSPEYAMDGHFSAKSDVFSFGVIVLEIVSGTKTNAFQPLGTSLTLLGYAWKLWEEGRGLELIDPSLGNVHPSSEVSRCIHVALLCVQNFAADRPTMSDVVSMLCSETASLPTPTQPAFSIVKDVSGEVKSTQNSITTTAIEGR